ncbi:MAG: V-type ATP synthase subunit D [Desulfurococcaceae archaeon]
MSSKIIKIPRPTKIELLRLKRRLRLAIKYHEIVKERVVFLVQAFREVLRKSYDARRRLNELLVELYTKYYDAISLHGYYLLEKAANTVSSDLVVKTNYKNISGVWTYSFEIVNIPTSSQAVPIELADLQARRKEILELLFKIAEYEKEMFNIGNEILRLKRIANILEKVYIPRLRSTIKYLSLRFEELYREDSLRTLRIKKMVTERGVI